MYKRIADIADELGVTEVDVERVVDLLGVRIKMIAHFLPPREAELVRSRIVRLSTTKKGQSSDTNSANFVNFDSEPRLRAHEVAKAWGLTSREFISICRTAGVEIGSHLSYVSQSEIQCALEVLGRGAVDQSESLLLSDPTPKRWPQIGQYVDALANAALDFASPSLKSMRVSMPDGTPGSAIRTSGAFACVAKVEIDGRHYALRLLIRNQPGLERRYREIASLIAGGTLGDNLAHVSYLPREVSVQFDDGVESFPVILVEWVDGTLLSKFVEARYLQGDSASLLTVHQQILNLRTVLQRVGVSHGDLSGDNIMVVGNGGSMSLKLLDYDSMWFREIADLTCAVGEAGNLQHPLRPNPIGPFADEVAFRMYDLGLRFLIENDDITALSGLFDQRILLTRDEWISCSSPLASRMADFDPTSYSLIGSLLTDSYEAVEAAATMPLGSRTTDVESIGQTDEQVEVPRFNFDDLCSELEVPVGALRRLLVEAGLGATDVSGLYSEEQLTLLRELTLRQGRVRQFSVENPQAYEVSVETTLEVRKSEVRVGISVVAKRSGLGEVATVTIAQDVLARSMGLADELTSDEVNRVLARVREDRKYPYELGKICRKAAISERIALDKLTRSLPGGVLNRSYGVRLSVEARDFLLSKSPTKRPTLPQPRKVPRSIAARAGVTEQLGSDSLTSIARSSSVSLSEVEQIARLTLNRWVSADEVLSEFVARDIKVQVQDIVRRFPIEITNLARELDRSRLEVERAARSFGYLWRTYNFRDNTMGGRLSFVGANDVRKRVEELRTFDTSLEDLAREYGVNLQDATTALESCAPIWLTTHALRIGVNWYIDEVAKMELLDNLSAPSANSARYGVRQPPESPLRRWFRWQKKI